jgi:hypothetical protein
MRYADIRQIIFNSLCGLCTLSLIVASTRSPGTPDPSLTPSHITRPVDGAEKERTRLPTLKRNQGRPTARRPPPLGIDGDDIPLRYLRNSQWVNSRIGKDRPSPLPLISNRLTQSAGPSETSSSLEGALPNSPFPASVNPLVPHSAKEAGEDRDEQREDVITASFVEGREGFISSGAPSDTEEGEGAQPEDSLLTRERRGRRSIMTKGNDGGPRWCKKCDAWKPDRTHHCRFCKRCTLKSKLLHLTFCLKRLANK